MDAAHGEGIGPVPVVQRVHVARIEVQISAVDIARGIGRGCPIEAVRANVRQGPRRRGADARGRSMTCNRWNECTEEADGGSPGTDWDR